MTTVPEAASKKRIIWLMNHRVWSHPLEPFQFMGRQFEETIANEFYECATFEYVWVDPVTERIEDDESRNTAFRIWVEAGPFYDRSKTDEPAPEFGWTDATKWGATHDLRLDCNAPTLDGALLKLADLVEKFYNEDGSPKD